MKRTLSILTLLIIITAAFAQQQKAEKITLPDSKLDNLYKIDEGVYRSEQPSKKDFKALETFGIKEVLNLRRFHSDNDEAEDTDIKLHRLKTHAHSLSEKQVVEALRIIKDRQGPILIHCRHGSDRTGGVLAMYRIVFQDYTKEEAIEEMRKGGFGFHKIYRNIVRMIRKADIPRIRQEVELPQNEN
ncbi:dual specificity protein phosphatase family protein [Bacteroides sp. 51]|uniref:dual specificity protein phosphatase family protein n=1 Tax=Bacteroides sp. 51 TaxID=2302938 RepID=UPI0013D702C7|nr:dual specificity protein phosphatase family protein [Bacteroides sp. 51]NDV81267.1 protein tyrosine phosphatase [Bacteroides sp. 51]